MTSYQKQNRIEMEKILIKFLLDRITPVYSEYDQNSKLVFSNGHSIIFAWDDRISGQQQTMKQTGKITLQKSDRCSCPEANFYFSLFISKYKRVGILNFYFYRSEVQSVV